MRSALSDWQGCVCWPLNGYPVGGPAWQGPASRVTAASGLDYTVTAGLEIPAPNQCHGCVTRRHVSAVFPSRVSFGCPPSGAWRLGTSDAVSPGHPARPSDYTYWNTGPGTDSSHMQLALAPHGLPGTHCRRRRHHHHHRFSHCQQSPCPARPSTAVAGPSPSQRRGGGAMRVCSHYHH
jgi:hypothetical protein